MIDTRIELSQRSIGCIPRRKSDRVVKVYNFLHSGFCSTHIFRFNTHFRWRKQLPKRKRHGRVPDKRLDCKSGVSSSLRCVYNEIATAPNSQNMVLPSHAQGQISCSHACMHAAIATTVGMVMYYIKRPSTNPARCHATVGDWLAQRGLRKILRRRLLHHSQHVQGKKLRGEWPILL